MFNRNIFVLHLFRCLFRCVECPVGFGRDIDSVRFTAAAYLWKLIDFCLHIVGKCLHIHTHFVQQLTVEAVLRSDKAEQKMFLLQCLVAVCHSNALCILQCFYRFLCKFVCVHNSLL